MGFALLFVATTVVTSAISIQPAQAQMQFHSRSAQNTPAVTIPTHFATAETDNCGFGWALDWIACPLSGGLLQFITDMIRNVVSDLLYMDTNQLFSPEFKTAWTVFQRIGFAVIIISGLIMVISHSLGMELFDAYTIKKLLPRLVIAIFGMAVAWPMLKFVITFFNDIGLWTHSLIVKPFENIGNDTNMFDLQNPASAAASAFDTAESYVMEWGIVITALLAGAIQAAFLGPAGILSLVATIALAVLIGVATLIIRQIIIMVTVLFAPLAIACYVLPGTKKIANFWQNTLTTTLMMFPIVMAFIGAGEAMSRVAASAAENSIAMKLLSILVYFAPYFMLPMAFKMAGGLMSNVFGLVNDRTKGAFDRLRNFRDETKKRRKAEIANEQLPANRFAKGWAQRSTLAAQGGFETWLPGKTGSRARERYEGAKEHMLEHAQQEAIKRDGGFISGDTSLMDVLSDEGITREQAIERYAALHKKFMASKGVDLTDEQATHHAEKQVGKAEAAFNASVGSRTMANAAAQAWLTDNTSGGDGEDWRTGTVTTDKDKVDAMAAKLINSGRMDSAAVARLLKSNKTRADRNALGFADLMTHLDGAAAIARGDSSASGSYLEEKKFYDKIREGITPGEIAYGHPSVIKKIVPIMEEAVVSELQEVVVAEQQHGVESDQAKTALRKVKTTMASMQGILSQAGQSSRERGEIIATLLQSDLQHDSKGNPNGLTNIPETLLRELGDLRYETKEEDVILPDGTPALNLKGEPMKITKRVPRQSFSYKLVSDHMEATDSWYASQVKTMYNEAVRSSDAFRQQQMFQQSQTQGGNNQGPSGMMPPMGPSGT